ncbi:Sbal_3080 family lipoprotein [Gallaecimonas sp. GXIMD4217]|uniref:Sbal_3080 family lipoprotein n=1 Tax=Gallaecimonas sp. GXIMD4217 TaxID=3131927 RepID=UPI00311AE15B
MTMRNAVIACAALLCCCSIVQQVQPVQNTNLRDICIIENPATRNGFLNQYQQSLQNRGYSVKVMPRGTGFMACPLMTTYEGHWSWDLALYMSYARLDVYLDGKPVGQALYDSRRGVGRMDKFIDAETKIDELVSQLYPARG